MSVARYAVAVALSCASLSFARAEGVNTVDCQSCHPGSDPVTTTITSVPATPNPGDTVTLTINIRGAGSVGGLYLRSGGVGRFANLTSATKLIGGEPVHSQPLAASNGAVTYTVSYTATTDVGGADIEAFTVLANDNRQSADDTASYGKLSLGWGCDGGTFFRDADGDGIGSSDNGTTRVCGLGFGWSTVDGDCDDRDGEVKPGAAERCNGRDDDCDGDVDEGFETQQSFADLDGDGFGNPATGALGCGTGRVTNALDCNDADAAVKPGAVERCNGVDDDCDGVVDGPTCQCVPAAETCNQRDDDCDGEVDEGGVCTSACVPAPETCNGVDDDCDGVVDEGCAETGCGCSSVGAEWALLALVSVWRRAKRRAERSAQTWAG